MTIMGKDFDFEAIKRARQRSKSNPTDLVAALKAIAPDIEKLKAGQTARLEINDMAKVLEIKADDENRNRKAVMAITAKLNNLTPLGGAWAGRVYRVISDENYVYVQRGNDVEPVARKRGGRKPASATKSGDTVTQGDGALVTEHA